VCLDWVHLKGDTAGFVEADRLLGLCFGESEERRGRHFYRRGLRYEGGAELHWEHPEKADDCLIVLSGGALSSLESGEAWELVKALRRAGFTGCTRLDVALDLRGDDVRLVELISESCYRGELCGAKRWKPDPDFCGRRVCELMVRLGRRGNVGSGRYARVYDKGLETKTAGANQWQRFEVEYTGQVAAFALAMLLESERDGMARMVVDPRVESKTCWEDQAVAMALGAFDFREVTGSRELGRRPRVSWWAAFVGQVECVRVKAAKPVARSLKATARWVRKCVAPTLVSMMRRSGRSLMEVLTDLVGSVEAVPSVLRASVFQYECQVLAQKVSVVDGGG